MTICKSQKNEIIFPKVELAFELTKCHETGVPLINLNVKNVKLICLRALRVLKVYYQIKI